MLPLSTAQSITALFIRCGKNGCRFVGGWQAFVAKQQRAVEREVGKGSLRHLQRRIGAEAAEPVFRAEQHGAVCGFE